MIEKHYGRYMSSDFGQRLMADLKAETEIKTEMEAAGQKGEGTEVSETAVNSDVTGKRPRRDLNPCCRRERPVSWARLDDRDVMVSRAGFEPATLCLKGRCSTA
jgi:hypothetical protein